MAIFSPAPPSVFQKAFPASIIMSVSVVGLVAYIGCHDLPQDLSQLVAGSNVQAG